MQDWIVERSALDMWKFIFHLSRYFICLIWAHEHESQHECIDIQWLRVSRLPTIVRGMLGLGQSSAGFKPTPSNHMPPSSPKLRSWRCRVIFLGGRNLSLWTTSSSIPYAAKAWGEAEAEIQRGFFSYCLDRFQRNPKARSQMVIWHFWFFRHVLSTIMGMQSNLRLV